MILHALDNNCAQIPDNLKKAFACLRVLMEKEHLPEGRIELEGDRMYALVVRGPGRAREEAPLETHRRYIDVQYTLEGTDRIGWRNLSDDCCSRGYDAEKDLEFYDAEPVIWLDVPCGYLVVFYPNDAHAPMANTGKQTSKIVIKVAV